jgi:hypothetical protein
VQVGSSLREGLLLGVVEHLLSIDADIKWQEIVDAPTGGQHNMHQQQYYSSAFTLCQGRWLHFWSAVAHFACCLVYVLLPMCSKLHICSSCCFHYC